MIAYLTPLSVVKISGAARAGPELVMETTAAVPAAAASRKKARRDEVENADVCFPNRQRMTIIVLMKEHIVTILCNMPIWTVYGSIRQSDQQVKQSYLR